MEQILCNNLCVGYDNKTVIGPLNLTILKGQYWCITGENGVGKSTFIKTLLALIPAIDGSVSFTNNTIQSDIGYLPQQKIHQKNFPASVEEIVLSGTLNKRLLRFYYSNEEKKHAHYCMEKLGIEPLQKKAYRSLSGGQQQRVLLARALCATNKILILDEPVAGLDPVATKEMYAVIKTLNNEGITILMISHDIDLATQDATHLLHFERNNQYTITEKNNYGNKEVT